MTDKLFVFGLPPLVMLANVATDALSPETHIPVGVAIGICGVMMGAAWWLSNKFKGVDDKLAALEAHLKNLPCEGKGCNRRHADE